jgi:hypothetical protein
MTNNQYNFDLTISHEREEKNLFDQGFLYGVEDRLSDDYMPIKTINLPLFYMLGYTMGHSGTVALEHAWSMVKNMRDNRDV